jgi:ABC-type transport system involved in cytochrome c biogenesis permease subunit
LKKFIYILLFGIAALILIDGFRATSTVSEFDIDEFAELPVQVGGRIKPLDTVARNTLLVLSARQKVVTDEGVTLTPIEWFMDLTMRPELADTYPIFKIEFPDDLGLVGLREPGQRYYSFNDLLPFSDELRRLHSEINPEVELRSPYEKQIADINNGLMLYHRVMHSLHPIGGPERLDGLVDEYQTYMATIKPGMDELRKQQAGEEFDSTILNRFIAFADDYLKLSQTAHMNVIPPPAPIDPMDEWKNIGLELLDVMKGDPLSPYVTSYAALTMSYRFGDTVTFNAEVAELRQRFISDFPDDIGRVHYERVFNAFKPFYIAIQLYVLIFLVVCISWLRWPKELGKAAFWLLVLAFAIHTFGLLSRMYIQGRPPVTNLYSSAVFVGWGSVLLGMFIEKFYKNGIGAAMASLIGICTLIIAHHLAMSGDTLEMMRAVLDSNFWLATHVIIITFGYSAIFLAGALGLLFTMLGIFSKRFDNETARSLGSMVYGIIAFGTLFSLVGTILGGIWADQSWGRFWGWDSKENGALMIVLIGAIYLHARWGGICKERGLMAIAIGGNIITAWSWFGTNMLPVGLHSYGRMDEAYIWLIGFVLSQIFFIGMAMLPFRYWRSEFGQGSYRRQRKRILMAAAEAE